MTVDHIVPLSKGGDWRLSNLLPSCDRCNNAKGNMDIEQYRLSLPRKSFYGERRKVSSRRVR